MNKSASCSYKNWLTGWWSVTKGGGTSRRQKTYGHIYCAWLITWWTRHQDFKTLTRRSYRWFFQDPKWIRSGSKLQTLENVLMSSVCSTQCTPIHATTPQVVRYIKSGSILRKVRNTLQECGADIIPKDRTGQPKISCKVWYKITDSGTGGNILTMANEGNVHFHYRRKTT